MKAVQSLQIGKDEAIKRATQAEARALLLEEQNAEKSRLLEQRENKVETADRREKEKIYDDLQKDTDFINSDMSQLERCLDICRRRAELGKQYGKNWDCLTNACDRYKRNPESAK
jgi:hypothetical protein